MCRLLQWSPPRLQGEFGRIDGRDVTQRKSFWREGGRGRERRGGKERGGEGRRRE